MSSNEDEKTELLTNDITHYNGDQYKGPMEASIECLWIIFHGYRWTSVLGATEIKREREVSLSLYLSLSLWEPKSSNFHSVRLERLWLCVYFLLDLSLQVLKYYGFLLGIQRHTSKISLK